MSDKFLRFEYGKISLNNSDLMVNSAELVISPSLQQERVYGEYDQEIQGSSVDFVGDAPVSNLQGSLNISFYLSADTVSSNNINRIFELIEVASPLFDKKNISESPINSNIVGGYQFNNMFLNSCSISIRPFNLISCSASYDIYDTIKKTSSRTLGDVNKDMAHGLKSFGKITVNSGQIDNELELSSVDYSISVERKITNSIVQNENISNSLNYGNISPSRVSVGSIVSSVNIQSNQIIENLNAYGSQQQSLIADSAQDSSLDLFLYTMNQNKIGYLKCSGRIHQESLSITEGSHAKSSILIQQVIK